MLEVPSTEVDLIIHILHNLPEEHGIAVNFIENQLESDTAKLDRVKERLTSKHLRIKKQIPRNERALISQRLLEEIMDSFHLGCHKGTDCRKRLAQKVVHYATDRPEVPKVVSVCRSINCKIMI